MARFAIITLSMVALLALALLQGGIWPALALGYMTALAYFLDKLAALCAPDAPEGQEFPAGRGLSLLLGVLLWGLGLVPPTVALMLLGIPPLLAGTYAGIANVDPAVVDAARSMGMTERRILLRVETPNALPLILGGLRTATLQIVATATIAAYASLGGLGRYLIDGIKIREFYIALVGALMVTALALLLDALLAFAVWASAPGSGRLGRWRRLPQPLLDDEVAVESRPHVGSQSSSRAARKRGDASHTVEG